VSSLESASGTGKRAKVAGRNIQGQQVEVGGRRLGLSNLDKVLWPATGTTKGDMVRYYAEIAPVLLPHLSGRPVTLNRFPDGVGGISFFEKNCPSHRPPWTETVKMGDINYCLVQEQATLVWLANLAAIELHPSLATRSDLLSPTALVFDLDPGPPADVLTCAEVALLVRDLLASLGLETWVKTSGSKGLQLYAPLNSGVPYTRAKPFARAVALLLERQQPKLVISNQDRVARAGKVLIDWSQNTASKTTISVYSLRARAHPTVSTPVTWDEVVGALEAGEPEKLVFEWEQVLERVGRAGDLMGEILTRRQALPDLR
jgi:bifunctional non-homologous end joining protein LigD